MWLRQRPWLAAALLVVLLVAQFSLRREGFAPGVTEPDFAAPTVTAFPSSGPGAVLEQPSTEGPHLGSSSQPVAEAGAEAVATERVTGPSSSLIAHIQPAGLATTSTRLAPTANPLVRGKPGGPGVNTGPGAAPETPTPESSARRPTQSVTTEPEARTPSANLPAAGGGSVATPSSRASASGIPASIARTPMVTAVPMSADASPTPTVATTRGSTAGPPGSTPTPAAVFSIDTPGSAEAILSRSNFVANETWSYDLIVRNDGSVAYSYALSVTADTSSGLDDPASIGEPPELGLQLRVDRCDVTYATCDGVVYAGPLVVSLYPIGELSVGEDDHLRLTVRLPEASGNTFQGLTSVIRLTWVATSSPTT
jgi:hypothetical protein